jgi:aldose 1-epimerase
MHKPALLALTTGGLWALPALAQDGSISQDPLKLYTISAANITASFIPYGARLTSLVIPDRDGHPTDIVVGYDEPEQYVADTMTNHTYFGCIVGRYANRIENGTFTLDGDEFDIPRNEKDVQALHGGDVGYDQRNWTVTAHTEDSITFTLLDTAFEGFPGNVISHATYTVSSLTTDEDSRPVTQMTAKTVSIALTGTTPIMLSHHIYWNLNAFRAETVLNDTYLHMPLTERFIEVDPILIPTGEIGDVSTAFDGALDFRKPKLIGADLEATEGACGGGCVGYDNCFIVDRPSNTSDSTSSPDSMAHFLTVNSTTTGIYMQVSSNQRAFQIYTCGGQNGTIPVKPSQIEQSGESEGVAETIEQYGCVVVETQGWIDGINNPQWGELPYQVFSPETGPAVNWATYVFGAE